MTFMSTKCAIRFIAMRMEREEETFEKSRGINLRIHLNCELKYSREESRTYQVSTESRYGINFGFDIPLLTCNRSAKAEITIPSVVRDLRCEPNFILMEIYFKKCCKLLLNFLLIIAMTI